MTRMTSPGDTVRAGLAEAFYGATVTHQAQVYMGDQEIIGPPPTVLQPNDVATQAVQAAQSMIGMPTYDVVPSNGSLRRVVRQGQGQAQALDGYALLNQLKLLLDGGEDTSSKATDKRVPGVNPEVQGWIDQAMEAYVDNAIEARRL